MSDYRIIYEPVHGSIKVDGLLLELVETPELQRLRGIRQLGAAHLVFPGATHTRFEHSLGTSYVAGLMASALKLDDEELNIVKSAALLHDIGHGPFSHVLDFVLTRAFGLDHMKMTGRIITGEFDIIPDVERANLQGTRAIPEVLEAHGIAPNELASIACGEQTQGRRYLGQHIHSTMDADQIDYLMRDSHYTGVAYGAIDLPRLLHTIAIHKGDIVVHKKGVPALEGILVARALMFSSVYLHRAVRITDLMLAHVVGHLPKAMLKDVLRMTDSELIELLRHHDAHTRECATLIMYRKMFKTAYSKRTDELTEAQKQTLSGLERDYEKLLATSELICKRAGIPPGHVIIDIPYQEVLVSEPRIARTEMMILDDRDQVEPLANYSTLSSALQIRALTGWDLMVLTDERYLSDVNRVAEKVLFE